VFIRTFIYSETNTFRLPKLSNISFEFNIFVLIPVQAMVYLTLIELVYGIITPMDVYVSETINQKTYMKKFRGLQPT